jgi:hypothetical protein
MFKQTLRRKINQRESDGCSESNCRLLSSAAQTSTSISSSVLDHPKPSILLQTPFRAARDDLISRTPSLRSGCCSSCFSSSRCGVNLTSPPPPDFSSFLSFEGGVQRQSVLRLEHARSGGLPHRLVDCFEA